MPIGLSPGALDQRVTFQAKSTTRAANGEEVVTWSDVATVWAEAVPVRGREFFAAAQMQQSVDVRFRIRTRAGITGGMRLLWKSQPYDIVSIIPGTAQYADVLEIMAVSGVRNG